MASSIDIVPASNGDQCFISRLNVTITDAMRNKTIECFHDHSQLSAVIGNTTLMFTTGIVKVPVALYTMFEANITN